MNVLFVHSQNDVAGLNKPMRHRQSMPLGLSYISSVLKKNGHFTQAVVMGSCFAPDVGFRLVERAVREFGSQVIAYSSVSTEYDFIEKIAARARRKFGKGVFQIIGGPHASLAPDTVITGPFDALCVGEGEHPTLELVSCLQAGRSPHGIANLWIKSGENIEKNATRPFIDDLDEIPFPDRELWTRWISPRSSSTHSVLLGRGCPFDCSYCSNHALKKLAAGRYVRFRSPEKIVSEIAALTSAEPAIMELYLEVETIGVRLDWTLELCSQLADFNRLRTIPLTFGTNLRITPGCDYGDVFRAMKTAGFRFVNIGLESGHGNGKVVMSGDRRSVIRRVPKCESAYRARIRADTAAIYSRHTVFIPCEGSYP
ncbi:MAG: cobalamin-dependent protein [Pseudomonadota bacterium]